MKRRDFIKKGVIASSILAFPSWMRAKSKTKLPNVLILGDSISIGYTPFVKKELEGIANVYRPLFANGKNENCQGTTNGLQNIDRWIGSKKWDIIHFNFGLHDLKHINPITGKNSSNSKDPLQADRKQYKKNLMEIVHKLKKTNSKLVFATTTPYPDKLENAFRDPGMSKKYNRVALRVMKKNNIIVNDLYSFVLPRLNDLQIPKNVHFKKSGSEALGKLIADFVNMELKKNQILIETK